VFVAPGFAVVLLLKPRKRSLGAVILTALVVGSVVLFFSGGALVMSIVDFSLSPGGSAGGGGGGLATGWWWLMAGGGGAVTAWFVVPETTRRSPLFTAVLVTTSCAFASNLLLGLIMGVAPRGAYLASFYPGVAVLVSASLVGIWAKVCKKLELSVRTNLFSGQVAAVMAALLLAAVAVFGLSPRYVADPFFSFYEIEILAAELKKEGITSQESARAVLRSPGVLSLHSGLSLFLPKESADARPRDKALVALRLPGGKDVAAPAGGRLLAGADKTSLIVFPMLESISWDSFEVKSDSTPGGRWLTGALEINPQQSGPGYPEIVGLSSHDVSTGCVSYRFRVVPVGNMSRVLAVAGHCPGLGSEIRMLQVTGLRASVAGPDKVVLESGQRHSSGWLELTLCRERWRQTYDMIPFIFEFSQDDTEATELAKQINICGEGP
jgi:hypothetical protein